MKHPDNPDEKDNQPAVQFSAMGMAFWNLVNRNWTPQERDAMRAWAAEVDALWQGGTA